MAHTGIIDTRELDEELDALLEREHPDCSKCDQPVQYDWAREEWVHLIAMEDVPCEGADADVDPLSPEDTQRMEALRDLRDEVGSEWSYGATLVPESEFEDYAQQLAEDLDLIKPDAQWPYSCIDWEKAADELRMDYTSVSFDGEDYLFRA